MKNKLTDLNNHLFAQLERLSDEDLAGDNLAEEIERAKALTTVSKEIISTGTLLLNAHKAISDGMFSKDAGDVPRMLTE